MTLTIDDKPFNHITSVDIQPDGQWTFSCLCGENKPFATKKLAELVRNRHEIIKGVVILDDDE